MSEPRWEEWADDAEEIAEMYLAEVIAHPHDILGWTPDMDPLPYTFTDDGREIEAEA